MYYSRIYKVVNKTMLITCDHQKLCYVLALNISVYGALSHKHGLPYVLYTYEFTFYVIDVHV